MPRKSAKQVGALWRHTHEKVGIFLTGVLDLGSLGEVSIAVFRNDRKEKGSKQPDYRIVLSKQLEDGDAAALAEEEADPLAEEEAAPEEPGDDLPM